MTIPSKNRIESLDLLKGLVMVVMALDHVRDYFHWAAYWYDPADPVKSNLPIFFTRWITHFCAPTFSFLAGISAFLVSRRMSTQQLSSFLLKRGLWLIIIELTVVNFSWFFNIHFTVIGLLVIWSLGISMVFLAGLVYLPRKVLLIASIAMIAGHNLLDNVESSSILWAMLHKQSFIPIAGNRVLAIGYPIFPWPAIMSLGYCMGSLYQANYNPEKRRKILNVAGIAMLIQFAVLRYSNLYGDSKHFEHFDTISSEIISFFNPSKYPPSLLYVLMTLGGAFLFLANTERLGGKVVNFFSTFGRVPFFYYIIHIYLIHLLALGFAEFTGFGWQKMILPTWISFYPDLQGYGIGLAGVYLVWAAVIIMLYPLCKWFDEYKKANRQHWWLSYL